ncbi:MAG: ribosome biogenesis GTPase Der [Nitrospirales bacterium]|nr:ribosome biogenesis GTPase Der [Nitrospira sp.]MDR4500785.1 ribosome biogenesis GTPase Der [Nitrospirales bacterium]
MARKRSEKRLDTPLFTPEPETNPEANVGEAIPRIVIIGRPNVGKSTLFNRIVGLRKAIVDDHPGVTRDRHEARGTYQGRVFQLIDTGGLDPSATEGMIVHIKRQSELAIAEADLLIVAMDGRSGLTPLDQEIVSLVRGIQKPVFWVVNKVDTPKSEPLLADFYRLGLTEIFPLSAEHGLGVDELLEALLPYCPRAREDDDPSLVPRVAVVGRPNVGKSTFVNLILGEDRVVVSHQPGTTRDPVDSEVTYQGSSYVLTDTAGIRRRGRIERGVEGYSVIRAIRALGRSDVAILLLDGSEGVTEQDTKIAGLIQRQGRGCVLMVNKWDLREHDHEARANYEQELRRRFPFFGFVPVVFASALNPKTVSRVFPEVGRVMSEFVKRIPTGKLNQFLQQALEKNPLPLRAGNPVKSVYITQVATKPPTFALFVRHSGDVNNSYQRYLENALRESFGFIGTPIKVLVRNKSPTTGRKSLRKVSKTAKSKKSRK